MNWIQNPQSITKSHKPFCDFPLNALYVLIQPTDSWQSSLVYHITLSNVGLTSSCVFRPKTFKDSLTYLPPPPTFPLLPVPFTCIGPEQLKSSLHPYIPIWSPSPLPDPSTSDIDIPCQQWVLNSWKTPWLNKNCGWRGTILMGNGRLRTLRDTHILIPKMRTLKWENSILSLGYMFILQKIKHWCANCIRKIEIYNTVLGNGSSFAIMHSAWPLYSYKAGSQKAISFLFMVQLTPKCLLIDDALPSWARW